MLRRKFAAKRTINVIWSRMRLLVQEPFVRLPLILAVGMAAVCAASPAAAFPAWEHPEATVKIANVFYTFPNYWNAPLKPRSPLCRSYEDFHIAIVGRELFINGVLAYQAKRFDKVYVAYPQGVIVNGRIARPRLHKVLDDKVDAFCGSWD